MAILRLHMTCHKFGNLSHNHLILFCDFKSHNLVTMFLFVLIFGKKHWFPIIIKKASCTLRNDHVDAALLRIHARMIKSFFNIVYRWYVMCTRHLLYIQVKTFCNDKTAYKKKHKITYMFLLSIHSDISEWCEGGC